MISNSFVSFKANDLTSARDLYDAQLSKIKKTAQKQNEIVNDTISTNQKRQQIPMQGTAEKLDVTA